MNITLSVETDRTLNRDLDGGPRKEGGSFTGDFQRKRDFVFTRGIVHWGLRDIEKKALETESLSVGLPVRERKLRRTSAGKT